MYIVSNTVLIGLQPRGTFVAERLTRILKEDYGVKQIDVGFLDITFYRDDFRRGDKTLEATDKSLDCPSAIAHDELDIKTSKFTFISESIR